MLTASVTPVALRSISSDALAAGAATSAKPIAASSRGACVLMSIASLSAAVEVRRHDDRVRPALEGPARHADADGGEGAIEQDGAMPGAAEPQAQQRRHRVGGAARPADVLADAPALDAEAHDALGERAMLEVLPRDHVLGVHARCPNEP